MIVTVFRSRLKGLPGDYDEHVDITSNLVEQAPGFRSHKLFVAADGERLTLVEFESLEAQRAWSLGDAHRRAAIAGRKAFYAEYKMQVCSVLRESVFKARNVEDATPRGNSLQPEPASVAP